MWYRGMSESKQDVHVFLSPSLNDTIEEQLDYGDSKSAWIREAIRQRLEADN